MWQMAAPFILRSAGFPFAWMERLAFSQTFAATEAALDAEADLDRLAEALRETLAPVWGVRRDSGLRWKVLQRKLANRQALDDAELATCRDDAGLTEKLTRWNAAIAHHAATLADARKVFDEELPERRAMLRGLAADPRFKEAVFLSSPHMYASGLLRFLETEPRADRSSEDKRLERQITLYLQRFCTKNETTSFFGPITYGRFASDARDDGGWPVTWQQDTELGHREAFVAFWAVDAMATAMAGLAEIRSHLRPRHDPAIRIADDGREVYIPVRDQTIRLPEAWAVTLRQIDGSRNVAELTRLGHGEVLARLEAQHLICIRIDLSITSLRPLEDLLAFAEALPASRHVLAWRQTLARFKQIKDDFAVADLAGKARLLSEAQTLFETEVGLAADRQAGKIYADRSLLYEECRSGRERMTVAPAMSQKLAEALQPLLTLFARHGIERSRHLGRLGLDMFRELFPDAEQPVPLLRFMAALGQSPHRDSWLAKANGFESTVQQTLAARLAAAEPRRSFDIAEPIVALSALADAVPDDLPLLCSPDIMIARQPDGSPLLVLGEVHDTLMLWGWAIGFAPDAATLTAEITSFAEGLGLDGTANLLAAKRVKIVPFEYPGVSIAFRATSDSANPTVPIAAVDVVPGPDRLELVVRATGQTLRLHNGELPSLAHALFALPRCVPFRLDRGAFTPRLVAGDIVLQRACWRFDRATAGLQPAYSGTRYELFLDMCRLRRRLGLPERVFVKLPGEPKPIFVDFRSYFLLEMWEALLAAGVEAVVSEMLPDRDALWLTDETGAQVTAEIRTGFGVASRKKQAVLF